MTSRHWTSRKGVTAFVVGSERMSWPVRALSSGVFLFSFALPSLYVFPGNWAHLRFRARLRPFSWAFNGRVTF